ncbi:MAG: bifunctional nuclease family protein [Leptospira sp.]|nr:bifunctional nuclease family protein [Leptospira sp.]
MELLEVKISDISLTNVGFAVFLKPKDLSESKVVPIFIGPLETHSITSVLDGITPPRPMTHDLLLQIISTMGAQIIKVVVDEIIDNTFYAKISVRKDEEIIIIDARPSDSIAIALRAGAPIFIAKSVLDEAGIMMKEEEMGKETLSTGEISQPTFPKTQLQILEESLSMQA